MKSTIRIPTEQYAYLEFEVEGSAEEIIAEYHRITDLYKGGEGLVQADFNEVLDNYLWGSADMEADDYAAMSVVQKAVIQEIKKSKKRIAYKK